LSAEGAKIEAPKAPSFERRRRDGRGAESAEGGGLWSMGRGCPPPHPTRGSGGALWAPPLRSGAKPQPISIWCILLLKFGISWQQY